MSNMGYQKSGYDVLVIHYPWKKKRKKRRQINATDEKKWFSLLFKVADCNYSNEGFEPCSNGHFSFQSDTIFDGLQAFFEITINFF